MEKKVSDKYVSEVLEQTDNVIDSLDALARNLKGDPLNEVKRTGFDLDRVSADLARWQRAFRQAVNKVNSGANG